MTWPDLATRVRAFEIAADWAQVAPQGDHRSLESGAVVRFTIGTHYLAALNIDTYGQAQGDWYTTVTGHTAASLPLGDLADWSEIADHGTHVQIATAWRRLP
ncbi:hypothetical protein [Nocardia shimofusensis]|uniref:hypothetical protein n=1 Tax=Nocardia shimofusensis TaxID=228596 RepID=UPI000836B907|nr:hypothetical protein [Nocardia shimofusensis]